MAPIIAALANAGLTLLAEAIQKKGKEVVEKKLGIKIPDDPKELQKPEVVEQLHRIEIEHEVDLLNMIQETIKTIPEYKKWNVIDRASAREAEIAIATSEKVPTLLKYVKPALAFMITILTYLMVYMALFVDIPQDKQAIFNVIFGGIMMAFGAVITYYFGSSDGSEYKNKVFDVVAELMKKQGSKDRER